MTIIDASPIDAEEDDLLRVQALVANILDEHANLHWFHGVGWVTVTADTETGYIQLSSAEETDEDGEAIVTRYRIFAEAE